MSDRNINFAGDEFDIAVVIPCFKVKKFILSVIERIDELVSAIYVVDDACPEGSGEYVKAHCTDPRVTVVKHEKNKGVGGAVMTGYRAAIADGAKVIVKIDGDGQMDPSLLREFVMPILGGEADYTKGNRFYDLSNISRMPAMRLFGNAGLSFLAKLSTGYWNIFDPTNGYTAIHADGVCQFFCVQGSYRLTVHVGGECSIISTMRMGEAFLVQDRKLVHSSLPIVC